MIEAIVVMKEQIKEVIPKKFDLMIREGLYLVEANKTLKLTKAQ